jgi:transposase
MLGKRWTLQYDGARAHTAKKTKIFLIEKGVKVLKWPARPPDLNPIENLWSLLKRDVYQKNL